MTTTELKIKELETSHAQALSGKIAKLKQEESVRAILPEEYRKDALITVHDTHPHCSVCLWNNFRTDKKLADAVEVILQYGDKIVTCEHWKDSCVSTWPAKINTCINGANAVMDGSHVVEIDVHGGRGFGPDVTVNFWIDSPETGLVQFNMGVCDLWKLIPSVEARYNNHGEMTSCDIRWPSESQCVDSFRKFWSEKPGFRGSYYLADMPNFLSWAGAIKPDVAAAIN